MRTAAGVLICLILFGSPGTGQEKTFVLAADARLTESGLLRFVVPRFALKHGIRPKVVASDAVEGSERADLIITERVAARAIGETIGSQPRAVFYTEDAPATSYAMLIIPGRDKGIHATRFADWLQSEIGQKTVASFAADGQPAFLPGVRKVVIETAAEPTGDVNVGEKLALFHCGRCHVVSDKNRMGGIGSAPSFAALRALPGWQDKFLAFWTKNPHPSFTQVAGLTEPFDPDHPPHIAPVEITQEDIEAVFAYAATIPPKDLGAPISNQ
ncbi:MAG: hypothetical protein AAGK37_10000 [Pseudomonadota bacterium]